MNKFITFLIITLTCFISTEIKAEKISLSFNPIAGTQQELTTTASSKVYVDISDEAIETISNASEDPFIKFLLSKYTKETPFVTYEIESGETVTLTGVNESEYSVNLNYNYLTISFFETIFNSKTSIDTRDLKNAKIQGPFFKETQLQIDEIEKYINDEKMIINFLINSQGKVTVPIDIPNFSNTNLDEKNTFQMTIIPLPETPVEVGESWMTKLITISDEDLELIPEEYKPLLALLDQKVTFIESTNGIATLEVSQEITNPIKITVPNYGELIFAGTLMKGTYKVDEKTGIIHENEQKSDFSITAINKASLNDKEQITIRFVSESKLISNGITTPS